jgi:tetratricopeptide (TPR) repeat protein
MHQNQTAGNPAEWHDHAVDLLERFHRTNSPSDLEGATRLLHRVLEAISVDDPNRPQTLFNLGSAYYHRFDQITSSLEDLEVAIAFLKDGAPALVDRFPDLLDPLDVLVTALNDWLERTDDLRYIDEGVSASWRACQATSEKDPLYATRLLMLAIAMDRRATEQDRQDADQAVEVCRRLVAAPADRHVARSFRLQLLGNALMTRAQATYRPDDARDALQAYIEASKAIGKRDPERWQYMLQVADTCRVYVAMGWWDVADQVTLSDRRVSVARDGVKAAPDSAIRAFARCQLVESLLDRNLVAGSASDAEEAVRVARQAVRDVPGEAALHAHADSYGPLVQWLSAGPLATLGDALRARFKTTSRREDIDESVDVLRKAAALVADEDMRWLHLEALANSLRARFDHTGRPSDGAEAIALLNQVYSSPEVPTRERVSAARQWGELAAAMGDTDQALAGYTAAVHLLPSLAEHGTEQGRRERRLGDQRGLASGAADAALDAGRPELAVELLEQGRSVLWAQALRIRTDLSDLRRAAPDLAARLDRVRTELRHDTLQAELAIAQPGSTPARSKPARTAGKLRQLSKEWDSLVSEARKVPGFQGFLAPSTYATLRNAADHGPVVLISPGKRRCVALAVTRQGLVTIPLATALNVEERVDAWLTAQVDAAAMRHEDGRAHMQEQLIKLLGWVWTHITGPIVEALGYTTPADGSRWPRLWWCPVGPLANLPLHASGAVPDRVISSYTPTLDQLLRARSKQPPDGSPKLLAVGMQHTPQQDILPAVPYELDRIDQALTVGSGHGIETRLADGQARRAAVLGALSEHQWVHFSCHGNQKWFEPGKGALYLHDGALTVKEVGAQQVPDADLAVLSACRTAEGGVYLADEALTVAAAFHVSGYRHVIATLWPILDEYTPVIAQAIYEGLSKEGRRDTGHTAEALHHAVDRVRTQHPDDPLLWAPYIHIGP